MDGAIGMYEKFELCDRLLTIRAGLGLSCVGLGGRRDRAYNEPA